MSKLFRRLIVLAVLLTGLSQAVLAGGTNAMIPYKKLDELWAVTSALDQTKLVVYPLIFSTNDFVHPTNITLTIQSATRGMIPLALSTNGEVLKFPHEKELSRENPPIVSNQPKGTLEIFVNYHIALPDALSFRYARLGDGVAEANRAIKAYCGWWAVFLPKVQWVAFYFPKSAAGKGKVTIAAAGGNKEFTANKDGQVKFKLEKSLLTENPEVRLSESAVALPDIE